MASTVALIGRPNVGKSTLFNRLVGRRLAIVDERPGVTRDRREGEGRLFDLSFRVIDTAGLEEMAAESLEGRMRQQTERAVEEAEAVLFLIDARAGVTPLDEHFANWLRRTGRPIVLVANKCEGAAAEGGLLEAHGLGFGEPVALSGEHGLGLDELHERLTPLLASEDQEEEDAADDSLQLAIVGRPNVGKSTLVNQLLGEERMLTGPEAGITRDSIAISWSYKERPIRLVDTAGLRRRAKVTDKLEKLSAADTLRVVDFAQVVVLLLDAELGLEKQDLTIARRVVDEGRALVIGVNKWDACADRQAAMGAIRDRLERSFPQTRGIPVVTLSALDGKGVDKLMQAVTAAYEVWNKRVPTAALNRWLEEVVAAHPPPAPGGRRVRLKYITQARNRPPTFAVACSRPDALPDSYLRYLENALRQDFDLPGTPIRIHMRRSRNPYVEE